MVEPHKRAESKPAKENYEISVVGKALTILLAFRSKTELGLSELAAMTGLPKSSVFRLVVTLEAQDFLERSEDGMTFAPGIALLELGSLVKSRMQVRRLALPYLKALARDFGETANLGVLKHGEVVYVEIEESLQAFRISTTVGEREPLHVAALGKAIAAHLPWSQVEACLDARGMAPRTERTITSRAVFRGVLEEVSRLGYAMDDEEAMAGVRCIAAPILVADGHVAGAISISGPAVRLTGAVLERATAAVVQATRELSRQLGYQGAKAGPR